MVTCPFTPVVEVELKSSDSRTCVPTTHSCGLDWFSLGYPLKLPKKAPALPPNPLVPGPAPVADEANQNHVNR